MTISANTPARVVVLLMTIAVVLVLVVASGVGATVGSAAPGGEDGYVIHRVAAGDTLWDIATDHTAADEDIRRTVYEIKVVNDLDDSVIVPGQELRVPVDD